MASYVKKFGFMPVQEGSDDSFNGFETDDSGNEPIRRKRLASSSTTMTHYDEIDTKRRPTRRPDPKVTNRNAIMARENRRKHKERLERLEQENEVLLEKNCELQRQIKIRDKEIRRIKDDYHYMKSILANKTPILQILNSLKGTNLPFSSSCETFMTNTKSSSPESTATASSGYASPNLNEHSSDNTTEDDYEMNKNAFSTFPWDQTLFAQLTESPQTENLEDTISVLPACNEVQTEHSYSGTPDPGVCLHISNKMVSIEFCANCHQNAVDGWSEK